MSNINSYTWNDNPMLENISMCQPSVVNDDLMWLKTEVDNIKLDISSLEQTLHQINSGE